MRRSYCLLFLAVLAMGVIQKEEARAQFMQQGNKLIANDAAGDARFGCAVSLSADGNTAVVGGCNDESPAGGAVWVFTRSAGVWSQQGTKLVGTGAIGVAVQGASVSVSADGNTAIVGGPFDDGSRGAAWIFTRNAGSWSQQGDKLVGSGAVWSASQGISVALSADGNTAIVGGYNDSNMVGASWVFTRMAGVWSQQGNKLVGTGAAGAAGQGVSVSLSADGNTAIVGGHLDDNVVGAVWIFTRSGGVWRQQGDKLVAAGALGQSRQGQSVSLSADGNTAVVGGPGEGASWIFTRSGGVWSQQGDKLVGTGVSGGAYQGGAVSLAADGNTALVGGYYENDYEGAAWVFKRTGGVWSQHGNKLVGTGGVWTVYQGYGVALSADGETAVLGGPGDNGDKGAAWAWAYVLPATVPGNPELVEPENGALVPADFAAFTWHRPSQSGDRYWFELATDSAFSSKTVDSSLADTVCHHSGLITAVRYWWRVRAWNARGWGGFSDARNFTAVNAPDKANLASPLDGSTVPGENVAIVWNRSSPFVDRYWCEIATDSYFTYAIVDSMATDTSLVFPLLPDGTYWWKVRGHNVAGWGAFSEVWRFSVGATDVCDANPIPSEYALVQNYPNPFNPSTTIRYALPERSHVTLTVFNMIGQKVAVMVDGEQNAGYHQAVFDASGTASGVYLYRLEAGEYVETRKFVLVQ